MSNTGVRKLSRSARCSHANVSSSREYSSARSALCLPTIKVKRSSRRHFKSSKAWSSTIWIRSWMTTSLVSAMLIISVRCRFGSCYSTNIYARVKSILMIGASCTKIKLECKKKLKMITMKVKNRPIKQPRSQSTLLRLKVNQFSKSLTKSPRSLNRCSGVRMKWMSLATWRTI